MTTALKKLAIKGAIWTIGGYVISQGLRFGANIITTRLLMPEYFGIMAIVNISISGLSLLSDVGINLSIIQNKRGDDPEFLNTAWTIQIIRGICLWFVCLLLATPFANFYNEPKFLWLLPIIGLSIICDGFNSTALLSYERHLLIQKLTLIDVVIQVICLTVMVISAWLYPSIGALALPTLLGAVIKLVWSHQLMPEQPNRWLWNQSAAQEIFEIGRWVFFSTALAFGAEQIDRLLLGKLVSFNIVGVYTVALMLSEVMRQATIALSGKVILPTVAKLADLPRHEYRNRVLQSRKYLLLVLIFGVAVIVSFGDLVIFTLYDERYLDAAWMLPMLAIGIWPRLLCATIEPCLYVLGKMQYTTFGNLFRFLMTAIGIWLGYQLYGIVGAIAAIAMNDLVYYPAVCFGLQREGVSCLLQDCKATLLLLGTIAILVGSRLFLGVNFVTHPGL
jgi:O-antigen/teichoic acid export membrane protein